MPHDVHVYTLNTYISEYLQGNRRSRLQIVPHEHSELHTLLTATNNREWNMEKRIHKLWHANAYSMETLMNPTGYDRNRIRETSNKLNRAYEIFAETGRSDDVKRTLTKNINSVYNEEIQEDFTYVYIRGKYEILNKMDLGTKYGDRTNTK